MGEAVSATPPKKVLPQKSRRLWEEEDRDDGNHLYLDFVKDEATVLPKS